MQTHYKSSVNTLVHMRESEGINDWLAESGCYCNCVGMEECRMTLLHLLTSDDIAVVFCGVCADWYVCNIIN